MTKAIQQQSIGAYTGEEHTPMHIYSHYLRRTAGRKDGRRSPRLDSARVSLAPCYGSLDIHSQQNQLLPFSRSIKRAGR